MLLYIQADLAGIAHWAIMQVHFIVGQIRKNQFVLTLAKPVFQKQFRGQLLAALLLLAAVQASALSIGRLRGAAWLGQGLDLSVQVQLEAGETPAAMCFEAEVFHGDVRQESGRVRVSTPAAEAAAPSMQVRVQSAALVDEPVVTVYLRETCVAKVARRFVLLAELTPEPVAPQLPLLPAAAVPANLAAQPAASAPVQVTPVPERASPAAAEARPSPPPVAAKPKPRRTAPAQAPSEPKKEATAPKPQPPKPAAAPAKPTLKLDPVETLRERVMQLEAAAAQPPASATPEEVQRLQKLEQNLQSLLTLTAKNERSLAELREKLKLAETEKYDNLLVYALAALLLVSLAGLAYLLLRQRRAESAKDWWHGAASAPTRSFQADDKAGVKVATMASAASAAAVAARVATPPTVATQAGQQAGPADVDLDDLLGADAPPSKPEPAPAAPAQDTQPQQAPGVQAAAVQAPDQAPPVVPTEFPHLPGTEAAPGAFYEGVAEAAPAAGALSDFPAAAEVTIDLSHLSLTPTEAPPQVASAEESSPPPLLDFDLPGVDKKEPDKKE